MSVCGAVQRGCQKRLSQCRAMMPRRCLSESTADVTWDCGERGAFRSGSGGARLPEADLSTAKPPNPLALIWHREIAPCDSDFHKLIFNQACLSLSLALARTRLEIHNPQSEHAFRSARSGAALACSDRFSIFPIVRSSLFQTRRSALFGDTPATLGLN